MACCWWPFTSADSGVSFSISMGRADGDLGDAAADELHDALVVAAQLRVQQHVEDHLGLGLRVSLARDGAPGDFGEFG